MARENSRDLQQRDALLGLLWEKTQTNHWVTPLLVEQRVELLVSSTFDRSIQPW